ncbi:MAG: DinB family protein [Pedobacter sp.]|nr:MAG: DinB family protein [Pedobacter sp.]
MINKDEIAADFNQAFAELDKAIKLFTDKDFNVIPFADSWTAGQVAEHILLSNDGFGEVLNDKVEDATRAVDHLKIQLKEILLNFENKMKSPEFILPALKDYDKQVQLTKSSKIKNAMLKSINDLDLSKMCVSFPLPGLGFLTRLEAIYFVIYHTERHAHQLNEIYRFIRKS